MNKSKKISWILVGLGVLHFCFYLYIKSSLFWIVPGSLFFVLIILFSIFFSLLGVLAIMGLLLEAISWIFDWLRNRPHTPKQYPKFEIPYMFVTEKHTVQTLRSKTITLEIIKYFLLVVVTLWVTNLMIMLACRMYSTGGVSLASSVVRFPLADSGPVAIDSKGRIYCSSGRYDRLQVYDRKGHFVRGWFFFGGDYHDSITIDHNDLIYVQKKIGEGYTVFDVNGNMLNEGEHWPPEQARNNPALDSEGSVYKSPAHWMYSDEVVKISPTGKKSVIISDPLYLRIIAAIFPTWIVWLPVLFIAWGYQEYQKRKNNK